MKSINYPRRKFLQYTALGALATVLPTMLLAENSIRNDKPSSTFNPDVEIDLIAQAAEVGIFQGPKTRILQYQSKLLKGSHDTLKSVGGYLGPILNFQQGQKVRINFYNQLSGSCITHWHGSMCHKGWMGIRCMLLSTENAMCTSLK